MSEMNGLTDAQEERLTLITEECAEVIQAVSKIKRFGFNSNYNGGITNLESLQHELGDLQLILKVMIERGDVNKEAIEQRTIDKRTKINQYLRYNVF
jgi:NTP pyrophosphatase (non-canonical NTP hydrolase)